MDKIRICDITDITQDKIYYRNENGNIDFIELLPCADSYESAHNIINKNNLKVRCVGERLFGEYAYYELYTPKHVQLYMTLKTNKFQKLISKITTFNFHTEEFKQFYSVQKQLNANGWTTLDLS